MRTLLLAQKYLTALLHSACRYMGGKFKIFLEALAKTTESCTFVSYIHTVRTTVPKC